MIAKFKAMMRTYAQDETGAVTTDWVALTAGVLIIGAIIAVGVMNSTQNAAEAIAGEMNQLGTAITTADPSGDVGTGTAFTPTE